MNKITLDILRKPEDSHKCKSEKEFQTLQYKWFDCLVAAYHCFQKRSPSDAGSMEHSITKAYHHFSLAAADGNADALYNLAVFSFKGSPECKLLVPDLETAVKHLECAASQKAFFKFKDQVTMNIGVAKAENALGNFVRKRRIPGDDHVAYIWYRKSAEHGSTGGQNNLALCLLVILNLTHCFVYTWILIYIFFRYFRRAQAVLLMFVRLEPGSM